MRTFLAIPLTQSNRDKIAAEITHLKKIFKHHKVRWVKPENWHLTVKFLGDIDEESIAKIINSLDERLAECPKFTMDFGNLSYFPSPSKPRVLAININLSAELGALFYVLESALTELGFAPEKRSFKPHLSLARLNFRDRNLVPLNKPIKIASQQVTEVILYTSELTPKGSIYSALHTFTLQA